MTVFASADVFAAIPRSAAATFANPVAAENHFRFECDVVALSSKLSFCSNSSGNDRRTSSSDRVLLFVTTACFLGCVCDCFCGSFFGAC